MIVGSGRFFDQLTRFPGPAALLPCLGTALFIAMTGHRAQPTRSERLMQTRPLVFVGLISYSLYLWHWPLIAFALYLNCHPTGPLVDSGLFLLSLLVATLSWKFVERPFRNRLLLPSRNQIFGLALGCSISATLVGWSLVKSGGVPSRLTPRELEFAHDNPLPLGARSALSKSKPTTPGGWGTLRPEATDSCCGG